MAVEGGGDDRSRAPARPRRSRSGRLTVLLVVGLSALGGLGFGLWAGLTRKAPKRAGAPGSGIPVEGLGVPHPPRPGAPPPAPAPPTGTPEAAPKEAPAATPPPSGAVPPSGAAAPAATTDRKPGETLKEIHALVAAGKISAARALAEQFLKTTPTGPEAQEIMAYTGVHPHP